MADLKKLAEELTKLTVLEVNELKNVLKDEYGIEGLAVRDDPRYSFNVLESLETDGIEETKKKMNVADNQQDESFWRKFKKV